MFYFTDPPTLAMLMCALQQHQDPVQLFAGISQGGRKHMWEPIQRGVKMGVKYVSEKLRRAPGGRMKLSSDRFPSARPRSLALDRQRHGQQADFELLTLYAKVNRANSLYAHPRPWRMQHKTQTNQMALPLQEQAQRLSAQLTQALQDAEKQLEEIVA